MMFSKWFKPRQPRTIRNRKPVSRVRRALEHLEDRVTPAISITSGSQYLENFDGLTTTASTTTPWTNDSTVTGFSLFRQPAAGPVAITTITTNNGTSTGTGNFFNWGS